MSRANSQVMSGNEMRRASGAVDCYSGGGNRTPFLKTWILHKDGSSQLMAVAWEGSAIAFSTLKTSVAYRARLAASLVAPAVARAGIMDPCPF